MVQITIERLKVRKQGGNYGMADDEYGKEDDDYGKEDGDFGMVDDY